MCQMQHTITQFGLIPGPGSPGSPARGCPYRRVLCARHRGQSEEPEPRTGGLWELRPYERNRCDEHERMGCARPTGGSYTRTTRGPAQRRGGAKAKAARMGKRENSAAEDSIKAGVLHLASLQRRIRLPREDCYNVVT